MDLKKNSVSADEELEKLRYELEAEKQKKWVAIRIQLPSLA